MYGCTCIHADICAYESLSEGQRRTSGVLSLCLIDLEVQPGFKFPGSVCY